MFGSDETPSFPSMGSLQHRTWGSLPLFWPLVSCWGMSAQQQSITAAVRTWFPKPRGSTSFARASPYTVEDVKGLCRLRDVTSPLWASVYTFIKWKDWTRLPLRYSQLEYCRVCFISVFVSSPSWFSHILHDLRTSYLPTGMLNCFERPAGGTYLSIPGWVEFWWNNLLLKYG